MTTKKAVFHLAGNGGSMLSVEAKPEKRRMGREARDDPTGALKRERERDEASEEHRWLGEALPGESKTLAEVELRLREYKFIVDQQVDSMGNYPWGLVSMMVEGFVSDGYVKGIRKGDREKLPKLDVMKARLAKGIVHVAHFMKLIDLSELGEFRATVEEIDAFWTAFINKVKTTMKRKSGHDRANLMSKIDRYIALYG